MNFPGDQQRLSIVGATGSGKTHAAIWHLSRRTYDRMPWIVYDFKGDDFIAEIPYTFELPIEAPIPERPGIYIVRPDIEEIEDGTVSQHMTRIWTQENIGVFVDEGYMIGQRNQGFRRLLTQGRSKYIPMIILSQRPTWMDRFVFSESEFFQVFRLQHSDDVKAVEKFVRFDLSRHLPKHHSYYYDAIDNRLVILSAVPDRDNILDTFETRLARLRKAV